MTYKQKKLLWNTNIARGYSGPDRIRWNTREEFSRYIESIGGRLKEDKKRRKGYLVFVVKENWNYAPRIVAEFPMEFVDKALALGFLP